MVSLRKMNDCDKINGGQIVGVVVWMASLERGAGLVGSSYVNLQGGLIHAMRL